MGPPVAPATLPIPPRRVNANLHYTRPGRGPRALHFARAQKFSTHFAKFHGGPFLFGSNSLNSPLAMALPPKKPQTGRVPPGKQPAAPAPKAKAGPPTRRSSAAPASGRATAPAAPAKNNLPLILG